MIRLSYTATCFDPCSNLPDDNLSRSKRVIVQYRHNKNDTDTFINLFCLVLFLFKKIVK
jgi:hypothetical protein